MFFSPLNQFEIKDLIILRLPLIANINISLTNLVEFLSLSTFIVIMIYAITMSMSKIIYSYWNIANEIINDTVYGIVVNQINKFTGPKYFPFILSLFIFILIKI